MRLEVLGGRTCDGCTACCDLLGVPELDKRANQPCPLAQPGQGCSIHEARPSSCRHFECLWKLGFLSESHRPDELGAVVARQYQPSTGAITPTVYVRRPDWRRDERIVLLLDDLIDDGPVVVVTPAERFVVADRASHQDIRARAARYLANREQQAHALADSSTDAPATLAFDAAAAR